MRRRALFVLLLGATPTEAGHYPEVVTISSRDDLELRGSAQAVLDPASYPAGEG